MDRDQRMAALVDMGYPEPQAAAYSANYDTLEAALEAAMADEARAAAGGAVPAAPVVAQDVEERKEVSPTEQLWAAHHDWQPLRENFLASYSTSEEVQEGETISSEDAFQMLLSCSVSSATHSHTLQQLSQHSLEAVFKQVTLQPLELRSLHVASPTSASFVASSDAGDPCSASSSAMSDSSSAGSSATSSTATTPIHSPMPIPMPMPIPIPVRSIPPSSETSQLEEECVVCMAAPKVSQHIDKH
jgi:hypothetical protein